MHVIMLVSDQMHKEFTNVQAPVVQTVDSVIHWITQLVLIVFIRWIAIYPLDNAIHLLNDRGQAPVDLSTG